ncbi:MAG TPA: NrfD/PsrC family molybdoenzyme membrane anchor subunit [Ardenticatenaceae bacterium]|jgi:molybdopterin-containing oxidoreductase family membrane subunit
MLRGRRRETVPVVNVDEGPVLGPGHTFGTITDKISSIVLQQRTGLKWLIGFTIGFILTMQLFGSITWLVLKGVGIWGNNIPVAWAFDIINFVWWIGIGHAGTLISAILLLLRQQWRTSINRFAEAVTLFAVANAGLYPLLHVGRPWLDYWMFPYPNTMNLWPQWRSPLIWDVFAISTYATVSLLFWYIGLIPDLATLRDRTQSRFGRIAYGLFALGWRGSARHWKRYEQAYFLLAALSTPLVVSVHTIVSFDFAVSVVPGWHSTVFPPYFVGGALFAGFAMVLLIAIPLRRIFGLQDFITMRHIRNMSLIMLVSGLVVAYGYFTEGFTAWYSGNIYEIQTLLVNRFTGPYAPLAWGMVFCNVITPQLLWFRRVRTNTVAVWVISFIISIGMWLERFVIIVMSLHRDFIPGAWGMYAPTFWDIAMYTGTIGFFLLLMLLFIRTLPVISIFEMRELLDRTEDEAEAQAAAQAAAGAGD